MGNAFVRRTKRALRDNAIHPVNKKPKEVCVLCVSATGGETWHNHVTAGIRSATKSIPKDQVAGKKAQQLRKIREAAEALDFPGLREDRQGDKVRYLLPTDQLASFIEHAFTRSK